MLTKIELTSLIEDNPPFQLPYYENRREQLLAQVEPDSIIVLFSANIKNRNNDVDYLYRQESNFYYLTGWDEEEAIAVLIPGKESRENQFILFCQKKELAEEVWTGHRIGQEKAKEVYGAHKAFIIDEFQQQFSELLSGRRKIYYSLTDSKGHEIHPQFQAQLLSLTGNEQQLTHYL